MTQAGQDHSPILLIAGSAQERRALFSTAMQTIGGSNLQPSRVVTCCAAMAMAMVFSVQQGEHGPLVVYKLQVPKSDSGAKTASPKPIMPAPEPGKVKRTPVVLSPPTAAKAAPGVASNAPRLSPLKPSVLGTVVMPRSRPAQATLVPPIPLLPPAHHDSEQGPSYHVVSDAPMNEHMINQETGESLTLDEVTEAAEWRRETVERLRTMPLAPRF